MLVIHSRNVNMNYLKSVAIIQSDGEIQESRAGKVLVMPHPVMTVTDMPQERVLLCPNRDANPFFHFFECLWMMSGSNDGRWLDKFVRDFSARFGDDAGIIHGAYGQRWRHWPGSVFSTFCQLNTVVDLLRKNPLDRRVVISMWDPNADLDESHRDVPCNTHMYPRIREEYGVPVLDLTVCCRSNDIIWGATGANAVHFSFVQEWLAGKIGVAVGKLYQLSNNWHAYLSVLGSVGSPDITDPYERGMMAPYPIMEDPDTWDDDLDRFIAEGDPVGRNYSNPFFWDVAVPMWEAHSLWRQGRKSEALAEVTRVAASDWRLAAERWMERRTA